MSLNLVSTPDERLVSSAVERALRDALARSGRVVWLVPSFDVALRAQRELSDVDGLALGVSVTTPSAWAKERWEVWGDGSVPVDASARTVLSRVMLDSASEDELVGIPRTRGTLETLTSLVRDDLAWLPKDEGDVRMGALTAGERALVMLASRYRSCLRGRGLVESCEIMARLPKALAKQGVRCPAMVVSAFASMPYATVELVAQMSALCQVTVVAASDDGPAGALSRDMLDRLAQVAGSSGVLADREFVAGGELDSEVDPELAALRRWVFRVGEKGFEKIEPTGAVRRLEPAGPLAEAELVADEVVSLVDAGATSVVVSTPDTHRAWAELAPKLAARGMAVRGAMRRPLDQMPTTRAFMGFAAAVARLAELDAAWPADAETPDGPVPQLGSMDWWPPRDLTDFLLSDVSGVPRESAWRLDARWRGDRGLTPDVVLRCLQRKSATSQAVANATTDILRGRIGSAANDLLKGMDERDAQTTESAGSDDAPADAKGEGPRLAPTGGVPSAAYDDARACLLAIVQAARSTGAAGVAYGAAKPDAEYPVELSALVSVIGEVLHGQALSSRQALGPQDAAATVRICSRGEAASLAPHSADALVEMGLTSAEYPLSPEDGALAVLLRKLDLFDADDPLEGARHAFAAHAGVPRQTLVLERAMNDADAIPTYPAVVLTEALACYGVDPAESVDARGASALATRGWSEASVSRNLCASGQEPAPAGEMLVAPAGKVSEEARRLILVPREGDASPAGGVPSLSATQIETYLECPYKWFTLRRLGLGGSDADFSGMQKGSFAHRVLELTRTQMFGEAAAAAGLHDPSSGAPDPRSIAATLVPGTRGTENNLDHARELLCQNFAAHEAHQRQKGHRLSAQSLVPHTATEEYQLLGLRDDLLSELDSEVGRLEGFEPRYFELRFGGSGEGVHHVTYAGVDFLGSVDRVDVDAHGRAVVIDYKHKSPNGFCGEYDVFGEDGCPSAEALAAPPRRVQSLIYAQVIRRLFPNLKVVGALYLCTMGEHAENHVMAGALDANAADQVLGSLSASRESKISVGGPGSIGFEELLDRTEELVAQKIGNLLDGRIEASPLDKKACEWCPVQRCERRLS